MGWLQLALQYGSDNITRLLLSGAADGTLVGWVEKARATVDHSADRALSRVGCRRKGYDATQSAERWLVEELRSPITRAELVRRLIGVFAVDGGSRRTALFYARAAAVPQIVAAGADLEHRDRCGATPLLAAAYACDQERVMALLAAGCNVTAQTTGKRQWNVLHFAISAIITSSRARSGLFGSSFGHPKRNKSPKNDNNDNSERVLELIRTLRLTVSPEQANELLTASGAEHTPLMLACQNGSSDELIKMLTTNAPDGLLKRRDSKCRTTVHLSVEAACTENPHSKAVASLEALLGTDGAVSCVAAEDAQGATPYEFARDSSMGNLWQSQWTINTRHHPTSPRHQIGNTMLATWPALNKELPIPANDLKVCQLLDGISTRATPGHRVIVSFDEVRHAVGKAAETASNNVISTQDDEMQPAVQLEVSFGHVTESHGIFPNVMRA